MHHPRTETIVRVHEDGSVVVAIFPEFCKTITVWEWGANEFEHIVK